MTRRGIDYPKGLAAAQPAASTAFAISDIDAAKFVLPRDKEAYFGYVPAAAYDKKNHDANTLASYMSDTKKLAYIFHGDSSLSVGDTLYNAFDAVESLEHYCRVSILARSGNALEHCSCDDLKAELSRRECGSHAACKTCGKSSCNGSCASCSSSSSATVGATDAEVQDVVRRVMAALGN